jgi:hypothetical protein
MQTQKIGIKPLRHLQETVALLDKVDVLHKQIAEVEESLGNHTTVNEQRNKKIICTTSLATMVLFAMSLTSIILLQTSNNDLKMMDKYLPTLPNVNYTINNITEVENYTTNYNIINNQYNISQTPYSQLQLQQLYSNMVLAPFRHLMNLFNITVETVYNAINMGAKLEIDIVKIVLNDYLSSSDVTNTLMSKYNVSITITALGMAQNFDTSDLKESYANLMITSNEKLSNENITTIIQLPILWGANITSQCSSSCTRINQNGNYVFIPDRPFIVHTGSNLALLAAQYANNKNINATLNNAQYIVPPIRLLNTEELKQDESIEQNNNDREINASNSAKLYFAKLQKDQHNETQYQQKKFLEKRHKNINKR